MNLTTLVESFNHPVFIISGGLTVCFATIGLFYRIGCMIFGISPIVFRIGRALWKRKIAIIGDLNSYSKLGDSLKDSHIFQKNNIMHIPLNNIDKCKDCTVFIVDWGSAKGNIDQILDYRKNHHTSVIIYAEPGSITQDKMLDIANRANTIVVNFRGRLLNDLLNSMVTTSF